MNLAIILIILLVVFLVIEMSKHFLLKTVTTIFVIILVLGVVFLIVIGGLKSENMLKTDNEFIATGASVAETIQEQDLFEKIKDKLSDLKEEISNKIT